MKLMTLLAVMLTGMAVVPPKKPTNTVMVQGDAEKFYCVPTDRGVTCRSGVDVASFIRADDRECH